MIEIKLFKEQELKGYTLIEGFPGAGLVGPMASSYIIEKLGMEYIGKIESEQFPPIAAIHNSKPMSPARIYKSEKTKLIIFLSEFTIPSQLVNPLADEVLAFARKYGIAKIISVGGMPAQKLSDTVYVASSNPDILKKAQTKGIKPITEGVVAGVSASLIVKSQEYNIPSLEILVEVNPSIMDPKYAELAITGVNKLFDTNIDLSELDKEAKEVEAKIRDILKKVKTSHQNYANAEESAGPSMYA